MIRTIKDVECSQFTPGSHWIYGAEYYGYDITVEYPEQLDVLDDDELLELASEDVDTDVPRVWHVES